MFAEPVLTINLKQYQTTETAPDIRASFSKTIAVAVVEIVCGRIIMVVIAFLKAPWVRSHRMLGGALYMTRSRTRSIQHFV